MVWAVALTSLPTIRTTRVHRVVLARVARTISLDRVSAERAVALLTCQPFQIIMVSACLRVVVAKEVVEDLAAQGANRDDRAALA